VPNLGLPELLVILVIVILIFGAGKIPQLGKGLGEGIKNFKDSMREGQSPDPKDAPKNDGTEKPK
jgi:sec-independent protein translocase protein TatA